MTSSGYMTTTVIARIDFGNAGSRLYEPIFGQNTDDDDDDLCYKIYIDKIFKNVGSDFKLRCTSFLSVV